MAAPSGHFDVNGKGWMRMRTAADFADRLGRYGLLLRGGFLLDDERDAGLRDRYPERRQLLLIGNAGSAIWPHVAAFIADHPAEDHPLDRWTELVLQELAMESDAVPLFPFGGPPWWPFQQWAQRADNVSPSPLAILIHPQFGLWHAYRAAFLLRQPIELPAMRGQASPCESCIGRPCLTGCPVGAFSANGYDVENCASHVNGAAGLECRERGCLARLACPVGRGYRYESAHAAFHMSAFRRAHPGGR